MDIRRYTLRLVAFSALGVLALLSTHWLRVVWATVPNVASSRQSTTALADAMQKKLDFISANAKQPAPDERRTVFSEDEINAFFAQRRLKLPDGLESVVFTLGPGTVTAQTHVDFDKLTANARKDHPLLYIFGGVHDATVVAEGSGSGGRAHVKIDSLQIDGVDVPRRAMELFIERFVNPKYPNVRLEGDYAMPKRIDIAVLGDAEGTVTQK